VDEISEADYIDVLPQASNRSPNEAYIQLLETQHLAIRDTSGFLLDSEWTYSRIYAFLESHFKFLFHYFAMGPNADLYESESPFLVINKSRQTLRAVPCESLDLNGDMLCRNSAVPKTGQRLWRLLFGKLRFEMPVICLLTLYYHHSHPTCNSSSGPNVLEQREIHRTSPNCRPSSVHKR